MAKSYKELEKYLNSVKFRLCFVGGVDEEDVWRVFEQLHGEYDELLDVQHQYSLGAVGEWRNYALQLQDMIRENDEEVRRLRDEWNQLKQTMQKEPARMQEHQRQATVLRQNEMLVQKQYAVQREAANRTGGGAQGQAFSANQLLKRYGGGKSAFGK
ncbi:MAG: hypothetical protein VB091_04020 [Christensenella sp.]|nr:hypothetical protein [Christensenella sp.]